MIAALSPWHEAHDRARAELADEDRSLIGHVALESISTLSRMPEPHRVGPSVVLEALEAGFSAAWLVLDAAALRDALARIVGAGIRGGSVYDGLIAATAAQHGARLISADRRAAATYDALGVDVVFVS